MQQRYVPAAGRRALTRFYDPVIAVTMREDVWRRRLLYGVAAGLPAGGVVADVGCGTGTFAIALAGSRHDARVIGVDGDPEVLRIARAKPGADGVEWREGLADALPLADGEADAVVVSLLLHHLIPETKARALAEARRVLRPGGRLHVADWGRPRGPANRAAFFALRLIDGLANTRDHAAGRLPALIADAGFREVRRRLVLRTAWGSLELLDAVSPAAA